MSRSRIMPDEQGNSSPVFHLLTFTLFLCTLTGSWHGQGIKIAKWNKETIIEFQSAYADLPSTCLESFIQLAVCKVHFAICKAPRLWKYKHIYIRYIYASTLLPFTRLLVDRGKRNGISSVCKLSNRLLGHAYVPAIIYSCLQYR